MKVAAKQRKSVEFGRVHGRRDKWAPVYSDILRSSSRDGITARSSTRISN